MTNRSHTFKKVAGAGLIALLTIAVHALYAQTPANAEWDSVEKRHAAPSAFGDSSKRTVNARVVIPGPSAEVVREAAPVATDGSDLSVSPELKARLEAATAALPARRNPEAAVLRQTTNPLLASSPADSTAAPAPRTAQAPAVLVEEKSVPLPSAPVSAIASAVAIADSPKTPAPQAADQPAAASPSPSSPALAAKEEPSVQADLPVTFGRFISSDREALYNNGKYVELNYTEEPMQNVVRRLALASGINFVMPKIDSTPVSLSQRGNPFAIMETLIEAQGMGLVQRGDTWLITALDRVNPVPETYKLKHIHLDREFSFRDSTSTGLGASGAQPMGGAGGGLLGGLGGQSNQSGSAGLVTNPANVAPPRSVEERSSGNTGLLKTLERILEFGMDYSMDPSRQRVNIGAGAAQADARSSRDTSTNTASRSRAIYSYDPDANSLFVVATEQQHAWVKKWLTTIDQPTRNIEISVQFISTGKSNGSSVGVDWASGNGSNGFGNGIGFRLQDAAANTGGSAAQAAAGAITYGAMDGLRLPSRAILSSDALDLKLRAILSNTDTRTTKKPLLTTLTNREVLINNTQNQPVVLSNESGSTTTGGGAGGSTTNSSSSSIANENIGTVTRILPRIINDDLISLSVNIEITNLLRTQTINGNEYPIIAKTGFTNEVKVRSGYAVVIGGLEELIHKNTVRKLPILGDIPFFGFAFKDIVKGEDVSNLSLVITVRIIDESGNEYTPESAKTAAGSL